MQQQVFNGRNAGPIPSGNLQELNRNRGIHSEFPEQSRNSLKVPRITQEVDEHLQINNTQRHKGVFHSELREPSQHSLGTLNVGRARVQATDRVDTQQVPLTGYENFQQEVQAYPVSRKPLTVQPTVVNNTANSTILDLPNINTNLPPPIALHQVNQTAPEVGSMIHPSAQQSEGLVMTNSVFSNEILESIQSIAKVMQQQLMFNSETAEQGILQTTNLFQEMIKTQERRDLDPALLAIPIFAGQAADRSQCLDWISSVNVCDQSGCSF